MYQRQSPDYTGKVAEVARKWPEEWELARKVGDRRTSDKFIRRLAWELHKQDERVGLNGKRGSDELSLDALSYKNSSGPGGVEVIDVITGDHRATWQDVTIPPAPHPQNDPARHPPEGVLGKYIEPTDPGGTSTGGGDDDDEDETDLGPLTAKVDALAQDVANLEAKLEAADNANNELRGKIALLEARIVYAVVKGPTAGRGVLGFSHYHEVELPVIDSRTLPPKPKS